MIEFLRKARLDLLALLGLLVASMVPFADVLFLNKQFFTFDQSRFYYPTKRVIREVILSGEFPYWNRYYSAGQPMAANPEYEIFYPPQWLIFLPNFDIGYALHIVVHIFIATSGIYLLLRSMRVSRFAALFGAISFGLSPFFISLINLLPILFAAAWIPWALLFFRRYLEEGQFRDVALGALALGLQNLAGEPITILQTWILLAGYAVYEGLTGPAARWRAVAGNVLRLALLIGLGAALGAVQLLPAVDHVGDSARSRPFPYELVTEWSMPPVRPLELAFPNFLGSLYREGPWFWGVIFYPGRTGPYFSSLYFGLLVPALLFAWIFVRTGRRRWVALFLLLSLILAMGDYTPLYRFAYDTGIARNFRYPEKFILVGLFVCVLAAAVLLDRLLSGERRVRLAVLGFLAGTVVISAAMVALTLRSDFSARFAEFWGIAPWLADRAVQLFRTASAAAAVRGLLAFLLVALMAMPRLGPSAKYLLLLLVFVDLALLKDYVIARTDARFYQPPPVARSLDGDASEYRIFPIAAWFPEHSAGQPYFRTGPFLHEILRNGMFPMMPAIWGYQTVLEFDYDETGLLSTRDLVAAMWRVGASGRRDWRTIFMAMSNARYVTPYRDFKREMARVGGDFRRVQPVEFVKVRPFPRYYFSERLVQIKDVDDFIGKLAKTSYPGNVAFVPFPSFSVAAGTVQQVKETPNTAKLIVQASGPAYLVISVTAHKYWRAAVDGKKAELHRTNVGYQGLIVPAGRHLIEMSYRNPLVSVGAAISIFALTVLTVVVLIGERRR